GGHHQPLSIGPLPRRGVAQQPGPSDAGDAAVPDGQIAIEPARSGAVHDTAPGQHEVEGWLLAQRGGREHGREHHRGPARPAHGRGYFLTKRRFFARPASNSRAVTRPSESEMNFADMRSSPESKVN